VRVLGGTRGLGRRGAAVAKGTRPGSRSCAAGSLGLVAEPRERLVMALVPTLVVPHYKKVRKAVGDPDRHLGHRRRSARRPALAYGLQTVLIGGSVGWACWTGRSR